MCGRALIHWFSRSQSKQRDDLDEERRELTRQWEDLIEQKQAHDASIAGGGSRLAEREAQQAECEREFDEQAATQFRAAAAQEEAAKAREQELAEQKCRLEAAEKRTAGEHEEERAELRRREDELGQRELEQFDRHERQLQTQEAEMQRQLAHATAGEEAALGDVAWAALMRSHQRLQVTMSTATV